MLEFFNLSHELGLPFLENPPITETKYNLNPGVRLRGSVADFATRLLALAAGGNATTALPFLLR